MNFNKIPKFSAQGSDLAPFIGNGTKFQIPSEIKPPLNITWPNAEVMLFDGFSRFGIIKVAIVHLEFQHIKNALENYVKLLDHFSTAELQFLFEVNHDF